MDYAKASIDSIRWAFFNEQFLPSVIERKRRNDSQFSNLLGQLRGTEKVLCRLSERPSLEAYKPFLRELRCVVGRAITLVKDSTDGRERYLGEHYLEAFLELRWWTRALLYKEDDEFMSSVCDGEEYFVAPKGVLDLASLASSRLPSFVQKLYLWCSRSGGLRHVPSYGIEVFLQKTERLSSLFAWLQTEELLHKSVIIDEICCASAKTFIVEGKAWLPVLHTQKPSWVGDELKIVLLEMSRSGLVVKCEDSGTTYVLKRVKNLDQKQPVMARLCHPHIVQLMGYWRENGFLFLKMELMEGDLKELMMRRLRRRKSPFMMKVVVDILLQIAKAMLYLHDMDLTCPHLESSDVLFKDVMNRSTLDNSETYCLVKLGGFQFYEKNNFEIMSQTVYQYGLICLELLSKEPLHWEPEERRRGVSGEPKVHLINIQKGYGSTIPISLIQCIESCLDGSLKFSEVVAMLLLAQIQVVTRDIEESSIGSVDIKHLFDKPGTLENCDNVLRMMDKYSEALEDLNQSNKIESDNAFILRTRGAILGMMDKYSEALEDLNQSDKIQLDNAFTLKTRDRVLRMMHKYSEALEDLNQSNKIQLDNAFTLIFGGDVLQMMG